MITVEEAEHIVFQNLIAPKTEIISIDEAVGCVLNEDIIADRDFPPFNRVMMDGVAIDHHAFQEGKRTFAVEAMQPAGAAQMHLEGKSNCLEVMTGAVLPQKTDAVIRYEDITFEKNDEIKINLEEVIPFQNIHLRGTDRKKGEVLIKAGIKITAADIAVMATVGKARVSVLKSPSIAVVSTGDELVNIDETPHPYQIRKSNTHAVVAALKLLNCQAKSYHLEDSFETVEKGLVEIFEIHDVVILSGGVSKGKKDYVPDVLEKLKVEKLFHKVKQRPGKPFWFGKKADGQTVFALPGNPVSTFMCFYKYIKPWLQLSAGLKVSGTYAQLSEDFSFAPSLSYFLQVKLECNNEGLLVATPVKGQGSGDLANLLEADAFLQLPESKSEFKKGEAFPIFLYRNNL